MSRDLKLVDAENQIYFSDVFGVPEQVLEDYGALNISLINDLPLFIDPFLLFNSDDATYQSLHAAIIRYLTFLRDKATPAVNLHSGLLEAWFTFREVKQNWLGYSRSGNRGSGLGREFARSLHTNLATLFRSFGSETVTRGSHLEKLCLIADGVGRDNISDFVTNLITDFLASYTQTFAQQHLRPEQRRLVAVPKSAFNYGTESWESRRYELPYIAGDYVLLTPTDILTKEDVWISRSDLTREYSSVVAAIPNEQLRAQLNNYFMTALTEIRERDDQRRRSRRDSASQRRSSTHRRARRERAPEPTESQRLEAAARAITANPEVIDYFIRYKEDHGDEAVALASSRVKESERLFIEQVRQLVAHLVSNTGFYRTSGSTRDEALTRVAFLKDVIENKGGWRHFFVDGKPVRRESDLHIMFRLTWCNTPSDVNREVNNGRGPSDFEISRGRFDKSIVEFKLAKNTSLAKNLKHQAEAYQKASDALHAIKVIVYFTADEEARTKALLRELGLDNKPDVVLIDARDDNKPSASLIDG